MRNLIQPITVEQAYDEITHERWRTSCNWGWRMVGDDDGDDFPSPEPKTDSRSGLPRKNRRWQRLRIIKRDELFSLIIFLRRYEYIGLELGSGEPHGTHKPASCGQRACGPLAAPLELIILPVFFINSKKILYEVSGQFKNFYFCTKTTPRQLCWKHR